jgi:hypothetical protein
MAKRFAAGIGLGALVYLGMALYADWEELQEALRQFRWWLILPVLGGLHDEGSHLLMERLMGKVAVDIATARRLFTLLCALHWKG